MDRDEAGAETVGTTVASSSKADERELPTFDRVGERFAIGAELGRGGMGRVVAATDVALDRGVAIKQVLSDRDDHLIRFEREVRITAQLEHPSIVPIHEAGRDPDGRPFYVMRRIEGDPLSDRIESTRAGDAAARLALVPNVLAIVDAAAFAHARRIIHRDIKPTNILLGAYGETHLIDWGLARRLDELDDSGAPILESGETHALTQVGHIYGTIGYMAPEQARGEVVDERADVFALGATLFHVLAGKPPFEGMSAAERISRAASGADKVPLDAIPPEVPGELVTIVTKATANDLDARYRNAGELATDLRAFLAGQLVAAHHYTTGERVRRFVRTHRVAVAIASVAIATALVIGIVAIRGVILARDGAEDALAIAETNKRLAEDRAEVLLLDRAKTLASHDPTRAIALLRTMSPASPHLRVARDIASAAVANGVARGATLHSPEAIYALEMSTDGKWLAEAGESGNIHLYELATGRRRTVATRPRIRQLVWAAGGKLLVGQTMASIFVLDVASGAIRDLAAAPAVASAMWLGPTEDLIRYHHHARRELLEHDLRDDSVRVLARDVEIAKGRGDLALIAGGGRLRLLDGDREVLLYEGPTHLMIRTTMDVSRARGRVAAAIAHVIYEWDLAGAEVGRWATFPIALVYTKLGLYAATSEGVVVLGKVIVRLGRSDNSLSAFIAQTPSGVAYAYSDGSLSIEDAVGVHKIAFEQAGIHLIAGSERSQYVAVASQDGNVWWWDLAHVTPSNYNVGGRICWADEKTIVVAGLGDLFAVDRATHVKRALRDPIFAMPVECRGVLDGSMFVFGANGAARCDLATGALEALPLDNRTVVDSEANAVVFARDRSVLELPGGRSPERVVWTGTDVIDSFVTHGRWLLVSSGNRLLRYDRSTRSVLELAHVKPAGIAITKEGHVTWSIDEQLWWWDGAFHPPQKFPAKLRAIGDAYRAVTIELVDGSLWISRPSGAMNRAPATVRNTVFGSNGRAARLEQRSERFVMHYIDTNVTIVRNRRFALGVAFDNDRGLVVSGNNVVSIWNDPVPIDPAELHGWIGTVTNATIVEQTEALTWSEPP